MITVVGFKWVPVFARGYVRDIRARWALEEIGQAYQTRLIDSEEKATPDYRGAVQPFSQVPAYQEGEIKLFESGAIVLHIAEKSEALMPADPVGRARALTWVIAALNSIEPFIMSLGDTDVFLASEEWTKAARPTYEKRVISRLADLAERLEGREWLEDRFTCGDLMMASALRNLDHTDLVTGHPVLGPYLARCLARPAFQRAHAAQLADFVDQPQAA